MNPKIKIIIIVIVTGIAVRYLIATYLNTFIETETPPIILSSSIKSTQVQSTLFPDELIVACMTDEGLMYFRRSEIKEEDCP